MQTSLRERDVSSDDREKAYAAILLVIVNLLLISERLSGCRNQWDDRLEGLAKLRGVGDHKEYTRLDLLNKPFAVGRIRKELQRKFELLTGRLLGCYSSREPYCGMTTIFCGYYDDLGVSGVAYLTRR
jgi:hypothetical protein